LERLEPEGAKPIAGTRFDRIYFVAVGTSGGVWRLSVRGWDALTESLSDSVTAKTTDRRAVGRVAAECIERLFFPSISVDEADGLTKKARVTIRAGSLPAGSSSARRIEVGSILEPVFR